MPADDGRGAPAHTAAHVAAAQTLAGRPGGSAGGGSSGSSSAGVPVVDGAASAPQLLRAFQATQAQRSELYSRLHAGFQRYLGGRDEVAYRALMNSTTQGFAECSQKVIAIESTLKAPPVERADLAALLRRVQEGEKEKLQVTVSLHALRAAMALRSERQSMQQQQQQQQAAGGAPHVHHHGCGCGHGGDGGDEEAEEASEEECEAAVREMRMRLDRVVGSINEALEEVAQELEDGDAP